MNPALLSTRGEVWTLPISDSRPHAYDILRHLYDLAVDFGRVPDGRPAAEEIISPAGIRDNDVGAAAELLATWVRQSMRYLPDPEGTEYVITPTVLLQTIAQNGRAYGDCDDHVLLFCALARSIGLDARPVGVQLGTDPTDPDRFDHVIASVKFPGRGWKDFDLCAKEWPAGNYTTRLTIA